MRVALGVVALAVCLTACAERKIEKDHLARLPRGVKPGTLAIAEDGTAAAFVRVGDDGERVVVKRTAGPPYRECLRPRFAPGTRRLFHWVRRDDPDHFALDADGTPLDTRFGRTGTLVFSADGTRWAVVGVLAEKPAGGRPPVVVLSDRGRAGPYGDASEPTFSPDGTHLAWLKEETEGRVELVVDGRTVTVYEPPASRCAVPMKLDGIGPNLPYQYAVRYLADGTLLVLAHDREGWAVFRDGTRIASYPVTADRFGNPMIVSMGTEDECTTAAAIVPSSIETAEAAPVAAWWERVPGSPARWRVVRDGTPVDDVVCAKPWEDQRPLLSPDGRHVAYACAGDDGRVTVVADGRRHGPHADAFGYSLSHDGRHVAYDASDGSEERPWAIWVDAAPLTRRYGAVWRPRVAGDGDHVAWEAQRRRGGTAGVLGLDRRRIASFEEVLWGPDFSREDTVSWVIRRGRNVTRLDVPLE